MYKNRTKNYDSQIHEEYLIGLHERVLCKLVACYEYGGKLA